MNIVVWVMMSYTTHGWAVPTLEFSSEALCVAAVEQMRSEVRRRDDWNRGFCMRIEK